MKVLIANRGEIARRIQRTCLAMGHRTVAVYSTADAAAPFVAEADEAVCIGPAASLESYLRVDALLEAARRTGAHAVHPGYGFLAENAAFAQACEDAGLIFVGPTPDAIRRMGSKIEAKRLMLEHGVPVVPGYQGDDQSDATLTARALEIGFPLLIKASAGGGGKGMRVVRSAAELDAALAAARRESLAAFGDATLLLERYLERPRHIEFQIFGDGRGKVLHLFERECSIQRRHQKIVEEAPSVLLERNPALRERMAAAAVAAGRALDYRSAGTVEFIAEADGSDFYFLEINTRLQVEHPVTEETTGLDLVRMQLEIAAGAPLALEQHDLVQRGHSLEVRIYAEDPARDFLPATGRLVDWHLPTQAPGVRVDSGVETGSEVTVHYDPMLAKLITRGADRGEATRRMVRLLEEASILGVTTNRRYLIDLLSTSEWQTAALDTHLLERLPELARRTPPRAVEEAAAIVATLAAVASPDAPRLRPAWRNNPFRPQERIWEAAGREPLEVFYTAHDAAARHFTVSLGADGAPLRAELVRGDDLASVRLTLDGHTTRWRVVLERDGDSERAFVHGQGESFVWQARPRLPEPAQADAAAGSTAPMPGKVLQVLVEVGQRVEAGAALVILEAMKMELTVYAERDGQVAAINVEPGQQVEAGAVLVELGDEA